MTVISSLVCLLDSDGIFFLLFLITISHKHLLSRGDHYNISCTVPLHFIEWNCHGQIHHSLFFESEDLQCDGGN